MYEMRRFWGMPLHIGGREGAAQVLQDFWYVPHSSCGELMVDLVASVQGII